MKKGSDTKTMIEMIDRRIAELRRLRAYFRAQLRGGKR